MRGKGGVSGEGHRPSPGPSHRIWSNPNQTIHNWYKAAEHMPHADPTEPQRQALSDLAALISTGDAGYTTSYAASGAVVELSARGCGLPALPASLGGLADLERLDLSANQLAALPDGIRGRA